MGRTHLPYSMQIDLVEDRLKKLRRGLRKEDQKIFDRLMRTARMQIQAGAMASSPNPFDTMALTMLIEIQRQIDAQSEQIKALQNVVIEIKNQSLLHTEKEDGNS